MKVFKIIGLLMLAVSLSGCEQSDAESTVTYSDKPYFSGKQVYILGVHPLHNPSKLMAVYGPLADFLSSEIPGVEIRVEASQDYSSYDQKIEQEKFDFTIPNPFQTIQSLDNYYEVINQVGSRDMFKGLILVRKDSDIQSVSQLKGKRIAYPAPTALAATMMPQYYLHSHGLNLKETETLYVGSQESSIMNVYVKHTTASATWTVPWLDLQKSNPDIAEQLKVAWETQTLPNNSFMYHRNKVPLKIALKVQGLLANLHTHSQGKALLAKMNVEQIYIAQNITYKPVMDFLLKFYREVGDNTLLAKQGDNPK